MSSVPAKAKSVFQIVGFQYRLSFASSKGPSPLKQGVRVCVCGQQQAKKETDHRPHHIPEARLVVIIVVHFVVVVVVVIVSPWMYFDGGSDGNKGPRQQQQQE